MADVLAVVLRWLHISSAAILVGGMLLASMVLRAGREVLAPEALEKLGDSTASRFRTWIIVGVAALILSGIYNLLTYPGHSMRYRVLLIVKLVLVLHVFASALLSARPGNPRRARMMASAGISGLVVILISAYLRRIF